MKQGLNLQELGRWLEIVDKTSIMIAAKRMQLAQQVEEIKRAAGQKIFRAPIEDNRIEKAAEWAREVQLNPNFARMLMYALINESCKVQLIQLQELEGYKGVAKPIPSYEQLKENLTKMADEFAPRYDSIYIDRPLYAVALQRKFEFQIIKRGLQDLPERNLALDLGCATGPMSFDLAPHFQHVKGVDISPGMIEEANKKLTDKSNITFAKGDFEHGIKAADSSVALVVLNMGTASDVRDLEEVMKEVRRVLQPGGEALLSFYNRDALLYKFDFIPWPTGMNAEINLSRETLEVSIEKEVEGKPVRERREIFAKAYTVEEVRDLFEKPSLSKLWLNSIATYPTVCSHLPDDVLDLDEVRKPFEEVEETLADHNLGSYIVATVRKIGR
jgi:ubiquinone/menaquinone biosynthesis C-methylase UbiE/chorismate mutase